MDWKDAKDLLVVSIIVLVMSCLTSRCNYDIARDNERTLGSSDYIIRY